MKSTHRISQFGLAVLLAGLLCGARADPFVGYCYPCGMQAGSTVRLLVGGQGLGGLKYAWVSGDGVKVIDIENVPEFTRAPGDGQVKWVGEWIRNLDDGVKVMPKLPKDEILRNWPRNRWWESLDKLDALSLSIVKRNHFLPRPDPLQAAPAIAQKVLLTVVAEKSATPGVRELVLCSDAGASAPHPLLISVEPHAQEPLFASPPRKNRPAPPEEPRIHSVPVVLDGQIFPGETDVFDLELTGGRTFVCLLTGRELVPYLGDAVPGFFNPTLRLVDPDGKEVAFADDYYYLPDPVLTCKIKKSGVYRLEVRDNLYRGRDDFVYSVACHDDGRALPSPQKRAFVCRPRPTAKGEWSGCLQFEKACVSYDFKVERPETRTFDLFARRCGSPLDAVMRLYGPLTGETWKSGPLLATWDDVTNALYVGTVPQAECDPSGKWTFDAPGEYRLEVSDRMGNGGESYSYTLDMSPSAPTFEAYAVKSSFVVRPWKGKDVSFTVRIVRRNGFEGTVTVVGNDDFAVTKGEIPAEANEAKVTVMPTDRSWSGMKRVRFEAEATLADGRKIRVPVVAGDEVEQAFAYAHVVPAFDFLFYMTPRETGTALAPSWIEMPYDSFLPRRIIQTVGEAEAYKTDLARALDELSKVQVAVDRAPADANDGVLAAKFVSSAMRLQNDARKGGRRNNHRAYVVDKGELSESAAARAVLGGYVGAVNPQLEFREGNERVVRTMAFALKLAHDNDMLVYVPRVTGNPLTGPFGSLVRRFRENGWCFDFVTDLTLTNAPCGNPYRTIYVPTEKAKLPEGTARLLDDYSKRRICTVVYEKEKKLFKTLSEKSRREVIPEALRFARFGRKHGEGWYFIHNPASARVSGECRFNVRGRANVAYRMDVKTGAVSLLPKTKNGCFSLSLEAGASAWVYVSNKAEPE